MTKTALQWREVTFKELTLEQLYSLMKLRVDVFVVEQRCPYIELDNKDTLITTRHLLGIDDTNKLIAYSRVLAPGVSYPQASIGRVVIHQSYRGEGLAYHLMQQAITLSNTYWPNDSICIGAQYHLKPFYESIGFQQVSDMYREDGIPHIDMLL